MPTSNLKKYKSIVIKLKQNLTWEEYVSTLFFIKDQRTMLESDKGETYEFYEVNNELLTIVLSYNTKILIKIKEDTQDERLKNLISANKKIYKILFAVTSFKFDLFANDIQEVFYRMKGKHRKKLLDLVEEHNFLFKDLDLAVLQEMDDYLKTDKGNAIGYFNTVNEKINSFLRDKNL